MQRYKRVTYEVRCQIYAYLRTKISISEISKLTGYHRSSIYREIRRNKDKTYQAKSAHQKAKLRFLKCRRPKMFISSDARVSLEGFLKEGLSPEQISGRLKLEKAKIVSKQTIYRRIEDSFMELTKYLRHKPKTGRKGRAHRRRQRPEWMKSIHDRPQEVNARKEFGHWERDGMFTLERRQVVVFLERQSRFIKIARVQDPYTLHISDQMMGMVKSLGENVRSLTNDNGNEFLDGYRYDVPVYYCDPGSPNQKGGVENVIGLLRQYIPKKADLNRITDEELQAIEDRLNNRPRKCLDYKTPYEVFYNKRVALAS